MTGLTMYKSGDVFVFFSSFAVTFYVWSAEIHLTDVLLNYSMEWDQGA